MIFLLLCFFSWQTIILIAVAFALNYKYMEWNSKPVKTFTKDEQTNILITGGLRGLGKLLSERFAKNYNQGEIHLIILSRSDSKLEQMKQDL